MPVAVSSEVWFVFDVEQVGQIDDPDMFHLNSDLRRINPAVESSVR